MNKKVEIPALAMTEDGTRWAGHSLLKLMELANQIDFTCRVCGVVCDVAPNPPDRAVCPTHCDDHDYIYDRHERRRYCTHCGLDAPEDWGEL